MRQWWRQKKDSQEPGDHALGRSRGGYSTKVHLICDRQGHPLAAHLTPGQTHESQGLVQLLEAVDWVDQEDEPLLYPLALAGDKAYRADWIDEYLLDWGIAPVIPSKRDHRQDAREVAFDRDAYRDRNIIERLIGWLKESRRILTRFEKTATNYLAMIKWAFVHRYLRIMGC